MINLWLNKTDDFLCTNVRNVFEGFEGSYKHDNKNINLLQELQHFEMDPLVSVDSNSTSFEKDVKFKLKIIIGIFFVFIPLVSFILVSYVMDVAYSYAFIATLVVAIFASIRMDKIASKYSHFRYSLI